MPTIERAMKHHASRSALESSAPERDAWLEMEPRDALPVLLLACGNLRPEADGSRQLALGLATAAAFAWGRLNPCEAARFAEELSQSIGDPSRHNRPSSALAGFAQLGVWCASDLEFPYVAYAERVSEYDDEGSTQTHWSGRLKVESEERSSPMAAKHARSSFEDAIDSIEWAGLSGTHDGREISQETAPYIALGFGTSAQPDPTDWALLADLAEAAKLLSDLDAQTLPGSKARSKPAL